MKVPAKTCIGICCCLVLAMSGTASSDDMAGWGVVVNDTNEKITVSLSSDAASPPLALGLSPGDELNLLKRPHYKLIIDGIEFSAQMSDPDKFNASKPTPSWSRQFYSLRRLQSKVHLVKDVPARWKKDSLLYYSRLLAERNLPPRVFQDLPKSSGLVSNLVASSAIETLRLALLSELPEGEEIHVSVYAQEGRTKIECRVPLREEGQLSPELGMYLKVVAAECAQIPLSDVAIVVDLGKTVVVSGATRYIYGVKLNPNLFDSSGALSLGALNSTLADALATLPVAMHIAPNDDGPKEPRKIVYQSEWKKVDDEAVPPSLIYQHVQWKIEVTATIRNANPQSLILNCKLRVRHKYRGQPLGKFVDLDRATTLEMSASRTGFVEWNESPSDVNFEQIQKAVSDALHREFIRSAPDRKPPAPPV